MVAIPGASRVEHVQESIGAMQLSLSNQDTARLDEITNVFRMKE
ncbi:MAG: aldo/keto reductase [Anaerolineales bacterium]|nr:aldo/keto reductase [Anaerolineales bacterium]